MTGQCRQDRATVTAAVRRGCGVVLSVAALCLGPVAVAEPVALVIGLEGGTAAPGIEPFSEIPDGGTFILEPRTRLTFLHYRRCEQVTVESGTISFGAAQYRVVGGAIVSSVVRPCPRGSGGVSGQVGGVVLRGDPALAVSLSPTFVLTGPGAGAVARMRLSAGDTPFADALVTSSVVAWPADRAGLRAGAAFDLELLGAAGQAIQTIRIVPRGGNDRPVLLRVD